MRVEDASRSPTSQMNCEQPGQVGRIGDAGIHAISLYRERTDELRLRKMKTLPS